MDLSLSDEIKNISFNLLSSGKKVEPIKGQELYIFPASMPETNAPNVICKKIKKRKDIG
tara:strand:+ start:504 stop:680 length:177 start_codon:yes stop_codon:yes gene_type:complete